MSESSEIVVRKSSRQTIVATVLATILAFTVAACVNASHVCIQKDGIVVVLSLGKVPLSASLSRPKKGTSPLP